MRVFTLSMVACLSFTGTGGAQEAIRTNKLIIEDSKTGQEIVIGRFTIPGSDKSAFGMHFFDENGAVRVVVTGATGVNPEDPNAILFTDSEGKLSAGIVSTDTKHTMTLGGESEGVALFNELTRTLVFCCFIQRAISPICFLV